MSRDFCAREMRRLVANIPVTEAEDLMVLEEEVEGIVRRAAKATKEEMWRIAERLTRIDVS